MNGLYKITSEGKNHQSKLSESEIFSLRYHNLFDYPLSFADLIKWNVSEKYRIFNQKFKIIFKNQYFSLDGREGLIYKRVIRERVSTQKMKIAKKTAKTLSLIPSIGMIAVTGSLAMSNADDKSDIDLMIITKEGMLWTTRIFAYLIICLSGIQTRRPFDHSQKDKLCLNMWFDESDLIWRSPRNIYTAHEIAQIIPMVNKNKTYEKFLAKNKWILNYWPNSVRISIWNHVLGSKNQARRTVIHATLYLLRSIIEKIAFNIQYLYMKNKISREVVTKTRAVFHPKDIGKTILTKLHSLD
jgi:hypothetical protein